MNINFILLFYFRTFFGVASSCCPPYILHVSFLFRFIFIIFVSWDSRCLLYLLTYSMVQSPSWEANWFAASQEIPRISRNPNVHYGTHNRPPRISILGQPNPVHIPTFHLLEIHPNIIHPSTPRSSQRSLSLRFPHQDPITRNSTGHNINMHVD